MTSQPADLILHNGKIATQDARRPSAEAAAIRDGRFIGRFLREASPGRNLNYLELWAG